MSKYAAKKGPSRLSFLLSAFLIAAGLVVIPASQNSEPVIAAEPAAVCSSSAAAQNNTTVRPSHGKVMYIDTGQGQNINAAYVGYRVTAGANLNDVWVELTGFDSTEVVQLANPLDKNMQIGDLSNGSTGVAYFLLKADKNSSSAQTHAVRVYSGSPDSSTKTLLNE